MNGVCLVKCCKYHDVFLLATLFKNVPLILSFLVCLLSNVHPRDWGTTRRLTWIMLFDIALGRVYDDGEVSVIIADCKLFTSLDFSGKKDSLQWMRLKSVRFEGRAFRKISRIA